MELVLIALFVDIDRPNNKCFASSSLSSVPLPILVPKNVLKASATADVICNSTIPVAPGNIFISNRSCIVNGSTDSDSEVSFSNCGITVRDAVMIDKNLTLRLPVLSFRSSKSQVKILIGSSNVVISMKPGFVFMIVMSYTFNSFSE